MYLLKKYVFIRTYQGGSYFERLTGIVMIFMTIRIVSNINRDTNDPTKCLHKSSPGRLD
ncbi:hypothetical protein SAMN05661012_00814 [Chitinophaga sancti]|uniref:Uncharacterized protein n=1 Tax=Chitinophaga sancti TaxID=1004 RepID=A0A1K1MR13_9BACT|nr:hypothetical protein SAMN05661012_00814 [Chitinophaga sancti]